MFQFFKVKMTAFKICVTELFIKEYPIHTRLLEWFVTIQLKGKSSDFWGIYFMVTLYMIA